LTHGLVSCEFNTITGDGSPAHQRSPFTVQANEGSPDGLALSGWVLDAWSGEPSNVATDEHSEVRWISPDDALRLDLAHASYTGVL
jgi:hypothetical protein